MICDCDEVHDVINYLSGAVSFADERDINGDLESLVIVLSYGAPTAVFDVRTGFIEVTGSGEPIGRAVVSDAATSFIWAEVQAFDYVPAVA